MSKLISLIILLSTLLPMTQVWCSDESSAIKQTAMNYMESWYQGDAKRMKNSIHEKLAKRSLQYSYSGKTILRHTKASQMISYTKSGYGKELWNNNSKIKIIILDHYKNIATVKVLTPHYYPENRIKRTP